MTNCSAICQVRKGAHGNADLGGKVFAKAQCANCHKFGVRGDGVGPDLTTVSRRFQKKEILESVLFPSHVISDQYQSKTVLTNDGRSITGLAAQQADGSLVVLQSNGQKATIAAGEIEKVVPSKISAMPEGLLNTMSLEEVADLFAYLNQRRKRMWPDTTRAEPAAKNSAATVFRTLTWAARTK